MKTIKKYKIKNIRFRFFTPYFLYLLLSLMGFGIVSCNNGSTGQSNDKDSLSQKDILAMQIFYLLYEMENNSKVNKIIGNDRGLSNFYEQEKKELLSAINDCPDMNCLVNDLEISDGKNDSIINRLSKLYSRNKQLSDFIEKNIRPSHAFIIHSNLSDSALFIEAWKEEREGLNYILHAYLQDKGLHHAFIDSSCFDVKSDTYLDTVKKMINKVLNKEKTGTLFFQPTLNICLAVLELNGRDEAARFIPLSIVNQKAYDKMTQTNWAEYDYSSILIFGHGPDEGGVAIDDINKDRCRMGASVFNDKKAPFIIVSGGYVHPFQTPYCEAEEMKKFLMDSLGLPEDIIIMEPHARHTTTNIRDANRIIFNNNIPTDKPVLGVTSKVHIDYIVKERFKKANERDFGYVTFDNLIRLSDTTVSYCPTKKSLQINTVTPLDP